MKIRVTLALAALAAVVVAAHGYAWCDIPPTKIAVNIAVEQTWLTQAAANGVDPQRRIDTLFSQANVMFQRQLNVTLYRGEYVNINMADPTWGQGCTGSLRDKVWSQFDQWYRAQGTKGYWHLLVGCPSMSPQGTTHSSKCDGVSGSVWTHELNAVNLFAHEISHMFGDGDEPPFRPNGAPSEWYWPDDGVVAMCQRLKECKGVGPAPPGPAPPSPSGCADVYPEADSCPSWAGMMRPACSDQFMIENCRKSCGLC